MFDHDFLQFSGQDPMPVRVRMAIVEEQIVSRDAVGRFSHEFGVSVKQINQRPRGNTRTRLLNDDNAHWGNALVSLARM